MATSSTLRKAIGAVKDQTSIGIARVASQNSPELKVAIVKATSHEGEPPNEKYIAQILIQTSYSRLYVIACVVTISRRLAKTRNWIVALKSLMLLHRLLVDGDIAFQQEIMFGTRGGRARILNMSSFRDEAHSNGWDHSAFVRTYALYLDQKLELLVHEKKERDRDREKSRSGYYDEDYPYERRPTTVVAVTTPVREMNVGKVLVRLSHLQRLLDRLLGCRPTGLAIRCKMVYVALYPIVRESFKLYGDICQVLSVLLDGFFDMEYAECLKAFEAYCSVAKQIDELVDFYNWCKNIGVARLSEFPQVQRITDKLLETLEEFLSDKKKPVKSPVRKEEIASPVEEKKEAVENFDEIKALPAPEGWKESPEPELKQHQEETNDLIDIRMDVASAEDESNNLALALFQGNGGEANDLNDVKSSPWEMTEKEDWELALVESASNLSKQRTTFAGGMDPLLLNGMYDQGIVRQHVSTAQLSGGSASSVALPGLGKSRTPVLALPAPDGSTRNVSEDPFAASIDIPPPSYVQMADMEKKQQLLVQEQQVWEQYGRSGMQGQASLTKINGAGYYIPGQNNALVPYGMQPAIVPYGMQPAPASYGMQPMNGGSQGYYYRPY